MCRGHVQSTLQLRGGEGVLVLQLIATRAQWGQPLLLDAVAGIMGLAMDLKNYLLGCIRVPWKVKNHP